MALLILYILQLMAFLLTYGLLAYSYSLGMCIVELILKKDYPTTDKFLDKMFSTFVGTIAITPIIIPNLIFDSQSVIKSLGKKNTQLHVCVFIIFMVVASGFIVKQKIETKQYSSETLSNSSKNSRTL